MTPFVEFKRGDLFAYARRFSSTAMHGSTTHEDDWRLARAVRVSRYGMVTAYDDGCGSTFRGVPTSGDMFRIKSARVDNAKLWEHWCEFRHSSRLHTIDDIKAYALEHGAIESIITTGE